MIPTLFAMPTLKRASSGVIDPPLANVAVLMHFDAANNSKVFRDEKGNAWASGNDAKISNAQSKFGGTSGYFDGTSDYVDCTQGMAFGTGDFTIEAWVYIVSLSTHFSIFDQRDTGNINGVYFYVHTNGSVNLEMRSTSPSYTGGNATAVGAVTTGSWHHLTASRQGNIYSITVNGALLVNAANGSGYNFSGARARIGWTGDANSSYAANGYIDELRVTKGLAIYTAAHSVPVAAFTGPTFTDTHWPLVSSRFPFDGSNGSQSIADSAGTVWSVVGNTQLSTTSPQYGSAAALFDGGGDYLTSTNYTACDLGANDFTVEFWMKTTQTTTNAALFGREWVNSPYTGGWTIHINTTAGGFGIYCADFSTSTALMTTASTGYRDGNWHHIAWVRSGNTFTLYIDGVSVATATSSFVFSRVDKQTTMGNDATFGSGARAYNGRIDDFRLTRGVARYTSNFTPPAAALPTG